MSTRARLKTALKKPDSVCLTQIVTLGEAQVLSGMSRTALVNAMRKQKIACRQSITGGEWLIDLQSLINHYPSAELKLWLVK